MSAGPCCRRSYRMPPESRLLFAAVAKHGTKTFSNLQSAMMIRRSWSCPLLLWFSANAFDFPACAQGSRIFPPSIKTFEHRAHLKNLSQTRGTMARRSLAVVRSIPPVVGGAVGNCSPLPAPRSTLRSNVPQFISLLYGWFSAHAQKLSNDSSCFRGTSEAALDFHRVS
jgi:hypothetical protein